MRKSISLKIITILRNSEVYLFWSGISASASISMHLDCIVAPIVCKIFPPKTNESFVVTTQWIHPPLKKLRLQICEHQTWKKQRLAGIKFHSDYFIGVDWVFLLLAPLKKRVSTTDLGFVRFPVFVFIQILFCWFNQDEELATRYDMIPYRGSRHVYMPVCVRILGAWKRIQFYCQNSGYQSEDIFPFSAAFHISGA